MVVGLLCVDSLMTLISLQGRLQTSLKLVRWLRDYSRAECRNLSRPHKVYPSGFIEDIPHPYLRGGLLGRTRLRHDGNISPDDKGFREISAEEADGGLGCLEVGIAPCHHPPSGDLSIS